MLRVISQNQQLMMQQNSHLRLRLEAVERGQNVSTDWPNYASRALASRRRLKAVKQVAARKRKARNSDDEADDEDDEVDINNSDDEKEDLRKTKGNLLKDAQKARKILKVRTIEFLVVQIYIGF
jgi:hypothetical protein